MQVCTASSGTFTSSGLHPAMLLVAAVAAAAAAAAACSRLSLLRSPTRGQLPGPVLLDTYGRPLCDAYGQRLCVVRRQGSTSGAQDCIISCTGGPLCLRGRGHKADGLLLGCLPLLLGGPGGAVLLDEGGEPLLGAHNQRLRVSDTGVTAPALGHLFRQPCQPAGGKQDCTMAQLLVTCAVYSINPFR